MSIDPAVLEASFAVNTVALLQLARLTVPDMIAHGGGALPCTGDTSAFRGRAGVAGFAPTRAAQRVLLESIARRVGPEGVHAACVCIDAVIDLPGTRARMPDKPDDFFCRPAYIADACFATAHQPRSA